MQSREKKNWHYVVTRYPDGRIWYEGYTKKEEALARLSEEHTEYVGTSLPADVVAYFHEKELLLTEREFHLPSLQGTEKQIVWARDIRARYIEYLLDCSGREDVKKQCQEVIAERVQAGYWIRNRYALTVTTKWMTYVAEGQKRPEE